MASINEIKSGPKTFAVLTQVCDVLFRGNAGSDCLSDSGSKDGMPTGDHSPTAVLDQRQQTSSDVTGDAVHLSRHQIAPQPPSAAAATGTARRHDYQQLHQINGYDAHCYTANDAATAAATGGYLSGVPLSCVPPYFAGSNRASVFNSNHSLDTTGELYSMQRA